MVNPINKRERNLNSQGDLANRSFDGEFDTSVVQTLGFDGKSLQRPIADALATKITVVGEITYIAQAAPGTEQASAYWRVKKIDNSVAGETTITWADSNANFDNVATDLTQLIYG